MADEETGKTDAPPQADERPRRRNDHRDQRAPTEAGGNTPAADKKPLPKPSALVDYRNLRVIGDKRSMEVFASFHKGDGPLQNATVVFACNGTALGSRTTNQFGEASVPYNDVPLAACSFTLVAHLLNPFTQVTKAVVLPNAEKKDVRIKIADWKVISDYDPEVGRWALLVEIYDPTALYLAGIPITLMDAQQNPPFFEAPTADPHTRLQMEENDDEVLPNARRLALSAASGAGIQDPAEDPWITDKWGRFRYWLEGINLQPGERRDIYISSPFLEGVKTITFVGRKPKDPAPLAPPERRPGASWWSTQRAEWARARGCDPEKE